MLYLEFRDVGKGVPHSLVYWVSRIENFHRFCVYYFFIVVGLTLKISGDIESYDSEDIGLVQESISIGAFLKACG